MQESKNCCRLKVEENLVLNVSIPLKYSGTYIFVNFDQGLYYL